MNDGGNLDIIVSIVSLEGRYPVFWNEICWQVRIISITCPQDIHYFLLYKNIYRFDISLDQEYTYQYAQISLRGNNMADEMAVLGVIVLFLVLVGWAIKVTKEPEIRIERGETEKRPDDHG